MILVEASLIARVLLAVMGIGLLIGVAWCLAAYFTFHPIW